MPTLFSVFGAESALKESLVSEFSKIAPTQGASTISELSAQNAANVVIIDDFHSSEITVVGKIMLRVITNFTDKKLAPHEFCYYVSPNADPQESAREIVKRFVGFESRRSCVITPNAIVVPPNMSVILVKEYDELAPVSKIEPQIPKPEVREVPVQVLSHTPLLMPASQAVVTQEPMRKPRKKRSLPAVHVPKLRFHLHKKKIGFLLVGLIWIVCLPFALLLLSSLCSFGAYKFLGSPKNVVVTPLLQCSVQTARGAEAIASALSLTAPLEFSSFVSDGAQIALEFHAIYTGIVPEDLIGSLSRLSPAISHAARQVAVLTTHPKEILFIKDYAPHLHELLTHTSLLHVAATASSRAETLLGKHSPQTYVVLLQNNMELRPTGGFIGSFLLLDVDNGEVTGQKIYDVYDADGQLTGFVKPPEAISTYLGEASWHLRDSNWDPDFSVSAKRAIWFVDKSINRHVDGVIGVNLEVLKTFISVLGSVEVVDYGGKLTADNFYQTIQDEVHKEFFPGSRKKSNYLTAVFNAVFQKLQQKGSYNSLSLLSGLIKNLDSRDIQVYVSDDATQTEIAKAGIAGEVPINSLSFIEANVGVNKANQYIQRVGEWHFKKEGEKTQVTALLQLTNTAQTQTDETRYRVYLRGISPKGSTLQNITVKVANVQKAIVPETVTLETREESGAFFEVKGGEKALVSYTWTLSSSPDLSLWKQGGVPSYPLSIVTLTSEGERKYNTAFDKDIHIQL